MAAPLQPRRASKAGRLRDRVELQTPAETPDSEQQPQQTWNAVAEVWADVVATGGAESPTDGQVRATVAHKVTVRRTAATLALTAKDRLKVTTQGDKILNVLAVMPADNGREFLVVLCTEGA